MFTDLRMENVMRKVVESMIPRHSGDKGIEIKVDLRVSTYLGDLYEKNETFKKKVDEHYQELVKELGEDEAAYASEDDTFPSDATTLFFIVKRPMNYTQVYGGRGVSYSLPDTFKLIGDHDSCWDDSFEHFTKDVAKEMVDGLMENVEKKYGLDEETIKQLRKSISYHIHVDDFKPHQHINADRGFVDDNKRKDIYVIEIVKPEQAESDENSMRMD